MSISVLQANHQGTTATVSTAPVTLPGPTTAGNLIVALIDSRNQGVSSVTDDAGNTYVSTGVSYGPLGNPSNNTLNVWYAKNAASANTITAHFSGADSYLWNSVYEVAGADTVSPYITSASANSLNSGVLSLGGRNAIIFAAMVNINPPITAGTGYTLVNFGVTGDGTLFNATEYHVVSADEAATASAGGAGMILAAAFGEAAVAPTETGSGALAFGPIAIVAGATQIAGNKLRQFWTY